MRAFALADQARVAASGATVVVRSSGGDSVRAEVLVEAGSVVPHLPEALRWYAVVEEPRGVFAALELAWGGGNGSFVSGVDVETSDDLEQWRKVGSGAIAAFRAEAVALTRDRVELGGSIGEFLRVTVHRPGAGFVLTRLALHAEPTAPQPPRDRQQQAFAVGADTATVDLGAALPVDRFEVEFTQGTGLVRARLESAAAADGPWSMRGEALFYRFENGPSLAASGAAAIHGRPEARHWRAVLLGNAGGAAQLTLSWIPTDVVFAATGTRPYRLVAGNAMQSQATPEVQQARADARSLWHAREPVTEPALLGARYELAGAAAYDATPRRDWRSIALWALLGAGVLLVLGMVARLRRELRASG
jgi:hypothetical protein